MCKIDNINFPRFSFHHQGFFTKTTFYYFFIHNLESKMKYTRKTSKSIFKPVLLIVATCKYYSVESVWENNFL